MKTNNAHALVYRQGHALLLVILFLAISSIILAGALNWSRSNTFLNERNNQYFRSMAAAEAATEKVLTQLTADYAAEGEVYVQANVGNYQALVPTTGENRDWGSYTFYDVQNTPNRTTVEISPNTEYRVLSSAYRGLRGYATPVRIASRAREVGRVINVLGGIQQEVDLASIPIFQFAIFYNIDLEINPGPNMDVTGPVHCNASIYMQPQSTLTFHSDVTAVGKIVHDKKPGDPLSRTAGRIVYRAEHDDGVSSLNLPIGTNNSPATVRQIVEIPNGLEPINSLMGRQRFVNKADLVIIVTNGPTILATSGAIDLFTTRIPESEIKKFVTLTNTFVNRRENRTVMAIDVNVAAMNGWSQTNTYLRDKLLYPDKNIRIVYIADRRSNLNLSSQQPGVRLYNGQALLPGGLTVATPNPAYVKGNYNAPPAHLGTANTSLTSPAAVIADSVTVLSSAFNDRNTSSTGRAVPSTVNAAFLAGIVPTVNGSYSGGVENFPRFLEDWSGGVVFTYNGSMVVMFDSAYAKAPWSGGTSYYSPPTRRWAFDQNFRQVAKLPPGTPMMRVLVRGNWARL